jgi:hypothetical protein
MTYDQHDIAALADYAEFTFLLHQLRDLREQPLAVVYEGRTTYTTAVAVDSTLSLFGLAEVKQETFYGSEPYFPIGRGEVWRITAKGRALLEELDRRETSVQRGERIAVG